VSERVDRRKDKKWIGRRAAELLKQNSRFTGPDISVRMRKPGDRGEHTGPCSHRRKKYLKRK
jgi:hypothetical protein